MTIGELRKDLESLDPQHDTPVGIIHPYWARKPLNVVQTLIRDLSPSGGLVVDPFMGSGTSVFAGLREDRHVFGSDLNPLSYFLVDALLNLHDAPLGSIARVETFVEDLAESALPWFHYADEKLVERERFDVDGRYEDGAFTLERQQVILKERQQGKWSGRSKVEANGTGYGASPSAGLSASPIDFASIDLRPNSRIAVPEGATLDHYFTDKNKAFINLALKRLESAQLNEWEASIIRLLVSSAIPLLRLSDRKASSQWPYWRPKSRLTSRNPIMVLDYRMRKLRKAASWLRRNLANCGRTEEVLAGVQDSASGLDVGVQLELAAVQDIIPSLLPEGVADLVITDPPYGDQTPYLEYSALYSKILGIAPAQTAYSKEIVQTDAPGREADSEAYQDRLMSGLRTCSRLVKKEGWFVLFYQDHNLKHWGALHATMRDEGLEIREVVGIDKQRRSMKTVTSPGSTLDGDLILIFKKTGTGFSSDEVGLPRDDIEDKLQDFKPTGSLFEDYAELIRLGFTHGCFSTLADSDRSLRSVVQSFPRDT